MGVEHRGSRKIGFLLGDYGERRRLRWGWGLDLGSTGHGKVGDSITEGQ